MRKVIHVHYINAERNKRHPERPPKPTIKVFFPTRNGGLVIRDAHELVIEGPSRLFYRKTRKVGYGAIIAETEAAIVLDGVRLEGDEVPRELQEAEVQSG
jgi:hypothetical protein